MSILKGEAVWGHNSEKRLTVLQASLLQSTARPTAPNDKSFAQLKSSQAFSDIIKSMRVELNNPQSEYNNLSWT